MTGLKNHVKFKSFAERSAGVAQLVERNLAKVEVASSRLVSRSTCFSVNDNAGVAQLVERNLAKVEVASSRLVSRSRFEKKGGCESFPFFIAESRLRGCRQPVCRSFLPTRQFFSALGIKNLRFLMLFFDEFAKIRHFPCRGTVKRRTAATGGLTNPATEINDFGRIPTGNFRKSAEVVTECPSAEYM